MENKPIILVDVDGVLLDWAANLVYFAREHGLRMEPIYKFQRNNIFKSPAEIFSCDERSALSLMKKYSESVYGRVMPAFQDAVRVIHELRDKYDFVAVTCHGHGAAEENRRFNLNVAFGDAFLEIISLSEMTKRVAFVDLKARYGSRIVAFVDDRELFLTEAWSVFGSQIKMFHMIREAEEPAPFVNIHVKNWYEIPALL